ncbi:hypothetical protein C8F04DRAFT_1398194 [Mycena alexandri]|uniref:Uncharacterized protein n=1 Tax=Mycena alexandri TaxID=1745969 RepID=A0AAD6SL37_9AGAR|nr:hypothetical protein C8F04DRAFT_1398194 [Mycena alexandri]
MPETRESEASYIIVSEGLTTILEKHGPLVLEKLELDASEKEQKRFHKDHPASKGLPYTIDSKCTIKRGTNKAQGYVYPEMWRTPGKEKPKDLIPTLALRGISYTHRALILDLGPLFLMIQWMTHTSAQLFSRLGWESTVKVTDKRVRKFKVGLALVFTDYVLAFLTHDLVFQPTWRKLRGELPPPPDDFYSPNWAFISTLATWIRRRQAAERNGLACDAIRDANNVFLGIGVYTVVELFFLAGLSLLLTEEEVFSNSSRTARFCAAYLQYLHRSRTGLRALLRPAMKDGFLAPTKSQRLKYIDWLYVYAKDRTRLPARMAILVDDYVAKVEELSSLPQWIRSDTTSLYDVFEPSLLSTALSLEHNLGHLIFGDVLWAQLGGVVSQTPDKLTLLFRSQSIEQPTFLKPNHYTPLFLEASELTSQSLPRRIIYTYRVLKQMWSITPFPSNSQGIRDIKDHSSPYRIEGDERRHMLFSYIIEKTHRVAIGPLEYCGNAHRVSVGASTVVVPCYGDPTLPEFYAVRDLKSRALPPSVPGARRQGMDSTASKEFEYQAGQLAKSTDRKRAREEGNENMDVVDAPRKPKKKRLNADQRLGAGILSPATRN